MKMLNFKFELGATFYDVIFPSVKYEITGRYYDVDNNLNVYSAKSNGKTEYFLENHLSRLNYFKFESAK